MNPPMETTSAAIIPSMAPLPYEIETVSFWVVKLDEDDGEYFVLALAHPCAHWVEATHRSLEPVSKITLKSWPRTK